MPDANVGLNTPALIVRLERSALADAALVTVMVYVFVVVPSCAVTTVVMVLLPTLNATVFALPLAVVVPFTFIVDVASLAVGVTFIDVTLLATDAV